MPAPAAFRNHLIQSLTHLLPRLVDRIWDAAQQAQKELAAEALRAPTTPEEEQQYLEALRRREEKVAAIAAEAGASVLRPMRLGPRKPKLRQGEARAAVLKALGDSADGLSRSEL